MITSFKLLSLKNGFIYCTYIIFFSQLKNNLRANQHVEEKINIS